jgi:ABC-type Zn2+ transport system substrate-binding protein/surface adhesin
MSKTIAQRIAERFNNLTPEEREKLNKRLEEIRGGKDASTEICPFDEDEAAIMRDIMG